MSSRERPCFYFVAQMGRISFAPTVGHSNFYEYKLPRHCLATVELAVEGAGLEEGGTLIYQKEFLLWLNEHDMNEDE